MTQAERQKMIVYPWSWPASFDKCPPDEDFGLWLAEARLKYQTIFHFGTGEHHRVGQVAAWLGNRTIGITASRAEMDAYEELVIATPGLGAHYHCLFGDIYTLNEKLLPELDIVTLFHLCEFTDPRRMEYGGCTDAELVERLWGKLRVGGYLCVYPGSMAFDKAAPLFAALGTGRVEVQEYRSLRILRKVW